MVRFCDLKEDTLFNRVSRAVIWPVLGTGTAQGLLLLASILTARWLGTNDFGRLGLIQVTLNTVIAFITPTFGWPLMYTGATSRNIHQLREMAGPILKAGTLGGVMLSVGLLILTPWIGEHWFKDVGLQKAFQISMLSIFPYSIFVLQVSLLAGLEKFREVAMLNALRGMLMMLCMAIGSFRWGLNGAAWGITLSTYLVGLVGGVSLLRLSKEGGCFLYNTNLAWRGFYVLRDTSLPSFLSTALVSLAIWLGNVLLMRTPNGLAEVALFNATNHWRTLLLFLPTQISQSNIPILANLWNISQIKRFRLLMITSLMLSFITAVIPSLIVIVAAEPILYLYRLYSLDGIPAFRLLIFSGVMGALCSMLGTAIIAMGRFWQGLFMNFVWTLLLIGTAFALRERGAVGLAIAYTVAYAVLFIISFAYVVLAVEKAAHFHGGNR
ncbi:MAG: hypothetical protein QXS54_02000 [Candidatus Methanomethylicaceae archaeon]